MYQTPVIERIVEITALLYLAVRFMGSDRSLTTARNRIAPEVATAVVRDLHAGVDHRRCFEQTIAIERSQPFTA